MGREADLERVGALLSEHRLVTLIGPGGAGKTRLAVEAARSALEALNGGALTHRANAGGSSADGSSADGSSADGSSADGAHADGALSGGVWLAEFAPVTDPAEVAATVLGAFGLREQALLYTGRTLGRAAGVQGERDRAVGTPRVMGCGGQRRTRFERLVAALATAAGAARA